MCGRYGRRADKQRIAEWFRRRASRNQILTMRPNASYLSKSLKCIIKKATSPDQVDRFSSAVEFIAALQRLDLPDWRLTDNVFHASGWRGWDWKIETTSPSSPSAGIFRKRRDSSQFRRWQGALTLPQVFGVVEDLQE